ncbi:MAG: glycoside hydrolase family 31 [Porphyromonadaceae bacterium CG2_30_38_12]|nr:MAG: glycoside hydrolase family 31 [Porphyromonadaceae bacterium CG2_30_38_12]
MRKLLFILTVFISTIMDASQNYRLSEQLGNFNSFNLIKGGYELKVSNNVVKITSYNPTTIRIRVTRQKPKVDESFAINDLTPSGNLKVQHNSETQLILFTDSLLLNIKKNPLRINILTIEGEEICSDDAALGISWYGDKVSCYKKMHTDEKFIGLGEKTGNINRRGQYYQNWNTDAPAYALNADPLYSTIPFFIGVHDAVCYGIFFDNSNRSYFNFGGGADENIFHFGADDGEMNYYFFGGSTVSQIIKDYTSLTGRTPMPPLWSLGFQQSRWGYDNPKQIQDIAQTFRDKKLPADVMVCDINYMDQYKIFTWSDKFPEPEKFTNDLKKIGFDVVTIVDPGIKVEKGYKECDEGVKNNYFAKYPNGDLFVGSVWPGRCHFPDFTKEVVRKWWGDSFKESLVDNGVRGFWNDMNEPAVWGREFPNLIEFGEGQNKQTLHSVKNAYGLLMARSTYEGTKRLMNGQRPFVLTRASYAGVQKYSAQWTGDNVSSDEHMLLGFRLLNSMGLSGVPYVGMDVGGFMGNPSAELFTRWMSISSFSPLFRNHTAIDYNYREPWLFNDQTTNRIRKILEQRYQLLPHLYSAFYQAHTTGMPVNRMLSIDYTFDDNVYKTDFENEYLFGDNMLICPVSSSQEVISVYLPGNSTWYRFSNDKEKYDGGKSYNVNAALTDLPVFVKEGSVIPMQSVIQNTKEKGDGVLYLYVWKGKTGSQYVYYEDDGETYQYEQNTYYKRTITYDPKTNSVKLSAKEGNYNSKFKQLQFILHGFDNQTLPSCQLTDEVMNVVLKM